MKRLIGALNQYRTTEPERLIFTDGWAGDETCGAFELPSPEDGRPLCVIVSRDLGWEHVSVSRPDRCPWWQEMEFVKRKFFYDHETAMQLHVPPAEHRCLHPYVLHLWRPTTAEIPRPPNWMVGTGEA